MAKKAASKRKPNAAFMRPVTPDAALSEVVGAKPLPRTELTKKLWAYIKKNKLQDQKNKRMIKADDTLKAVFGGKSTVNMFEMTKLVSKHVKEAGGAGKAGSAGRANPGRIKHEGGDLSTIAALILFLEADACRGRRS